MCVIHPGPYFTSTRVHTIISMTVYTIDKVPIKKPGKSGVKGEPYTKSDSELHEGKITVAEVKPNFPMLTFLDRLMDRL